MPTWLIKLFHSLGRKSAAKRTGIAQIPTTMSAEGHAAGFYTTLREAGFKDADLAKLIKSEKDIIRLVNKVESMQNQRLRNIKTPKPKGEVRPFMGANLKVVPKGLSDEVATSQINKLRADLPSMNRNELNQLVKNIINRKAYASFDDAQRKELLDAIEYQTTHKPDFASGGIARVGFAEGKSYEAWLNYRLKEIAKGNLPVPFKEWQKGEIKMASGGIAGELHLNRPGYRYGRTAKKKKEKKEYRMPPMFPNWREPANFPYKSLEDIPEEVLEMLRKDPVFDLDTFLNKVAWSDPDKTRIQEKLKGDDEAWGWADRMGNMFLNYQHFGKKEPIAEGLLTLKSPTDQDKVQTILHEMRHAKMGEPWFWKSKAIPEWVRKYEEAGGDHYLDKDIKDKHKKYRETQKDVSGEELYVRYLDQLYGDVAEKGSIAGSDYKPYFDKILRDHWKPHADAYREILEAEKAEMSKPVFRKEFKNRKDYPLKSGGLAKVLGV